MMFKIEFHEGVRGGIVPPVLRRVVVIKSNLIGASIQVSKLKPERDSHKFHPDIKKDYITLTGKLNNDVATKLLPRIKEQLKKLPIEEPCGSQDIYNFDTSISYSSLRFQWKNKAPTGCCQEISSKKPNQEEKQTFKEIIDTINSLGEQYATKTKNNGILSLKSCF
ncbi:unnamed protein product [Cunninghamella blakesleeana]